MGKRRNTVELQVRHDVYTNAEIQPGEPLRTETGAQGFDGVPLNCLGLGAQPDEFGRYSSPLFSGGCASDQRVGLQCGGPLGGDRITRQTFQGLKVGAAEPGEPQMSVTNQTRILALGGKLVRLLAGGDQLREEETVDKGLRGGADRKGGGLPVD